MEQTEEHIASDDDSELENVPVLEDVPFITRVPDPTNSEGRFMESDTKLLEDGYFADVEMVCRGKTWKLHKNILIRCKWFCAALTGDFEEARTDTITISEFSPEIVDCVIRYIYTGVIDIARLIDADRSFVSACVRLWIAADFFLFNPLMEDSFNLLQMYFDEKLPRIILINAARAHETASAFIEQLFSGIATAYTKHPHTMSCRKLIVDFIHAGRIFFFTVHKFQTLLADAPAEFSHDMLLATIRGNRGKWTGCGGR